MADTIEIVQGTATTIEIAGLQGPQGPQGATGSGLGTLTTQGDTLYQGASSAQRLPIGTAGQILKVNSGGTAPEWGAAPASGVTSVNTLTGAVVLEAADVDAAADVVPAAYVLASTDPAYAPISGYYYRNDTAVNGKAAYYKIGTRENTSITYSSATTEWQIKHNATIVWVSNDNPVPNDPWDVTDWQSIGSDPFLTVSQADTVLFLNATAQNTSSVSTKSDIGLSNVDNTSDANKPISTAVQTALDGKAASSHTHGNLTNAGAIGTTANLPLKTGTNGVIEAGSFGTAAGSFCEGNDARLSDARTPSSTLAHASTHHTGGTDALAPNNISAAWALETRQHSFVSTSTYELAQGRNIQLNVQMSANNATGTIVLPRLTTDSAQNGDDALIVAAGFGDGQTLIIEIYVWTGSSYINSKSTVVTTTTNGSWRFRLLDGIWTLQPVVTHTHAASDITSGTLLHERGGLEADVSAYNGLVKIASGSTSAVTVTSAGEALLDDADAAAQRTTLGLGDAAVEDTTAFAASGSITSSGLTQSTARILGRTTASTGAVEEIQIGSGLSLSAGELSATGAGVTAVGASTADVLSVSGSDLVADDPNADRIVFWDDSEGKLRYLEAGSGLSISGTTLTATATGTIGGGTGSTDNSILRSDGTGGSTLQDSALVIDDATTSTQNNVAITNQHSGQTDSALVLTPKGAGAFIVGPKPDGTSTGGNARGARAIDIQCGRTNAADVASGTESVAIGYRCRATSSGVAIGNNVIAGNGVAIGSGGVSQSGDESVSIGRAASSGATGAAAFGRNSNASAAESVAVGSAATASLRGSFGARPFNSVYWGGQTTNATPLILNLDATATNRFTIAASTALAVDILLVARRSDTADKWLVARRFLGIRRDGSNNTALIGSVQTLGTDQSDGSPTWTFALTADDTNEALQLEVTGAASETIQWRATAFYRVA